jgi:SAM-dependent methyltransferase
VNLPIIEKLSSILAHPLLYLCYQTVVGGIRARQRLVREYVRPAPELAVLDIRCGPGYAAAYFPQAAYYGFDVSQQYIQYAKAKFGSRAQFYCQYFDEGVLGWLPPVDVVLLLGLLHHLDDGSAIELLELTKRAMKPSARLFTLDGCYRDGQSFISREFLRRDRGQFVRDESAYLKLARQAFPHVDSHVREDFFLIPYTTPVMECRLQRPQEPAAKGAGFGHA